MQPNLRQIDPHADNLTETEMVMVGNECKY